MVRIGKGKPILFVLMLSFFVISCGLPQDPVYVRGKYTKYTVDTGEDNKISSETPITIYLEFDGEHIYGNDVIHTDGFNVYYNYSNIVISDPQNYTYEYFLCYNESENSSDKPVIPLTYDAVMDGSFEFSYNYNNNTATILNKELYRNKNIDFSVYDEDDIINFTDENGEVFINFFIEYYVKRNNDGVYDSSERKYINSYQIDEFE